MHQLLIKKEYFVYDKKTIIERIVFNLNKLKKCLSFGLIIAIVLSMTGCGLLSKIGNDPVTKEELVSSALECVQNAESMDIASKLLLETTMEKDGDDYSLTADLAMNYQAHIDSSSLYFEADFEATEECDGDEDDTAFTMEAYIVKEDGNIYSYNNDGEGWKKVEIDEVPDILNIEKLLKSVNKKVDNFTLNDGTCTVEDKSCYAVVGKLDGIDYLLEMYDIGLIFDELDIDDLEAYISLYFDAKSKELVSVNLDFSSSFVELYEDVDDIEDVEAEQFTLTIICNSFNEVEEITVPKSVKNEVGDANTTKPTEPDETKPTDTTEPSEPSEPTKPNSSTGTASKNWKDFQFTINGHVFTLPCTYKELKEATGYSIKSSEEKSYLEPNYYTTVHLRDANGNSVCYIDVLNTSKDDATYADCMVIEIGQEDYNVENTNIVIEFAGLKVGDKTSKAELVAMFGQYDDIYEYRIDEDDDQSWKKYETDEYQWCLDSSWTSLDFLEITMNINTGIIEEIRMDYSSGVK